MTAEFKAWEKIGRDNPFTVTITEKIDGINACIIIQEGKLAGVQSRKRLITPEDDNFGFARWVHDNEEELLGLGDGYHYGEWAGEGIQKNPHKLEGKQFFLFNTFRWHDDNPQPDICNVVPVLFQGQLTPQIFSNVLDQVKEEGEAKGQTPEGIVIYYHAFRKYTKHTYKNPKGKWAAKLYKELGGEDGPLA